MRIHDTIDLMKQPQPNVSLDSPVCVYRLQYDMAEDLNDRILELEDQSDTVPSCRERNNNKVRILRIVQQNFRQTLEHIFARRTAGELQTLTTVHRDVFDAMVQSNVPEIHRAYVLREIMRAAIMQVADDDASESTSNILEEKSREPERFRIYQSNERFLKRKILPRL
jgi:hypothetical protein